MNRVLTVKKAVLHAFIINQIFYGLAYFGLGQMFVLLVDRDIHQTATQFAVNGNVFCLACASDIFGVQVARHINVTAFKHQTLGCAFLNVAHDDALHRRCAAIIVRIADQRDAFIRLPALQLIWTSPSRIRRKPRIAQIAVDLVGHHHFFIDDTADYGSQAV